MKSRLQCPVDVGIKVNLFLFEFNWTIVSYKLTATEELSPSIGLDLEAKSCIRRQAIDGEKRLILAGDQTDGTSKNQKDCALEMNLRKSALWSKRTSDLLDI